MHLYSKIPGFAFHTLSNLLGIYFFPLCWTDPKITGFTAKFVGCVTGTKKCLNKHKYDLSRETSYYTTKYVLLHSLHHFQYNLVVINNKITDGTVEHLSPINYGNTNLFISHLISKKVTFAIYIWFPQSVSLLQSVNQSLQRMKDCQTLFSYHRSAFW